ncbi:type II toxin-antitoxin system RelE/ParE family toxin [Paenibacillus sp. FSL R5-0766]|uniref:type II toxin-antitoxin system RelE/ParE family toxin n=1 Tax=unclassified Paenibacillus TaxID=185978 RepID=UPI00096C0BCF|nr:type II toxin-antitoxin system RelE/ParE family toxin [Paenibacillus sp. FSL R5-0765]OMF67978.1 hypothetical protein BK141_04055 [Paenibacillus sp. FSL R5-0765]
MRFIHFIDARGCNPVTEYLSTLQKKEVSKVAKYLGVVNEHGTRIGDPYVGHIQGKIWELRPGNYRILFFVWGDKFVLTNAFRKKGEKTPENEKAIAEKRFKDWIKQYGHN